MKKLIIRSLLGLFFGSFLAICATFFIIYVGNHKTMPTDIFVKNSIGTIFCGWLFTVTPLYFENKNWTLIKQTVLHFLTVATLTSVVFFGLQWIPFTLKGISIITLMFIIVYAGIWGGFYYYYKNEARQLTESLKNL